MLLWGRGRSIGFAVSLVNTIENKGFDAPDLAVAILSRTVPAHAQMLVSTEKR